eukprot:CAMPEP_0182418596 /NCGR_PEP_ID=MMETSP1167-20130531/2983_1 /TAXON_ID=2988 /ORGANISM="Mallomonas Sp, Strain CCMP3275" /LENGTH=427 /DNA_ID=CAMNT_0024592873 /DNA_START=143 /DNA_END=1426 /DNA_ORIENTATION=-
MKSDPVTSDVAIPSSSVSSVSHRVPLQDHESHSERREKSHHRGKGTPRNKQQRKKEDGDYGDSSDNSIHAIISVQSSSLCVKKDEKSRKGMQYARVYPTECEDLSQEIRDDKVDEQPRRQQKSREREKEREKEEEEKQNIMDLLHKSSSSISIKKNGTLSDPDNIKENERETESDLKREGDKKLRYSHAVISPSTDMSPISEHNLSESSLVGSNEEINERSDISAAASGSVSSLHCTEKETDERSRDTDDDDDEEEEKPVEHHSSESVSVDHLVESDDKEKTNSSRNSSHVIQRPMEVQSVSNEKNHPEGKLISQEAVISPKLTVSLPPLQKDSSGSSISIATAASHTTRSEHTDTEVTEPGTKAEGTDSSDELHKESAVKTDDTQIEAEKNVSTADWISVVLKTDTDEEKLVEIYETGFSLLMMEL